MDMGGEEIIADLHLHSRFARATSKYIDIPNLVKYAKIKGLKLLGTGDFQHPEWIKELKEMEEREGILYHQGFPFIWQSEISLMYKQGDRGRRVHHVILAPNGEVVRQVTEFLASKGRLDYDGRPIFGFSSVELVDEMQRISDDIEIIPAHCMTPWFGIFGSKSGFNSLKECFQEKVGRIHSVESGMSADPEMLRKFSFLNNKAVVSFSDLHSFWPWRIGRESTIFTGEISYKNISKQIRENSFKATVETEPAYGRYHWDGHRNCKFSCSPEETRKLKGICPKCGKQITIGVEYRIEELADQKPEEFNKKQYYKLLPLHELIALAKASTLNSKKTWQVYNELIEKFGDEFNILLYVEKEELARFLMNNELLVDLIMDNRRGKIKIKPGYDGVYGEALLREKQARLFS
jgi:uncharacterized protein (TIGR00375 family)